MRFRIGKLYKLNRHPDDRGMPFKAGDLGDSFVTASGEIDYVIISVHDGAILLFLGEKVLRLNGHHCQTVYQFLYGEKIVIFKKTATDGSPFFEAIKERGSQYI